MLTPVTRRSYSVAMSELVRVTVERDHLERIASGLPISGVAELIWNAVDADANEVRVVVDTNGLGGVDSVRVEDNGHGMDHERALHDFQRLGGSWKVIGRSEGKGRLLHGREGKGRWRAFSIGPKVTWTTTAETSSGSFEETRIEGSRSDLAAFTVHDPKQVDGPAGTSVVVEGMTDPPRGLLGESAHRELATRLVLYLEQYDVEIRYDGQIVNPNDLQDRREDFDIDTGTEQPARLTVIEWNPEVKVDRALFLCDQDGFVLDKAPANVAAPGFEYTAYLSWGEFRNRLSDLGIAELTDLQPVIDAARTQLRDYFRTRAPELAQGLIETWKKEQVYPYADPPSTPVEEAEQKVFEVVSVAVGKTVNTSTDLRAKRLSLRLMKEALEQDPGSLHRVLRDVLELPQDRLEELDRLLGRTSLANVISAAKQVADRLDFLRSLEDLLFDETSKKQLLERSQLHRILASEPWLFGEEFALIADDETLTTVLKRHIALLKGTVFPGDGEEVVDTEGKRGIVDLIFAGATPQNRQTNDHLVVELKRPNVKIGREEINQIQAYADAVTNDDRFSSVNVNWDFVVVSNELHEFAKNRLKNNPRTPGLLEGSDDAPRIWLKTWSQIIDDAKHRLKFFEQSLNYSASSDSALAYLDETHAKYLPPALAAKSKPKE